MATMTTFEGQFLLEHTVTSAGQAGVVLSTENKFVDKNIGIRINTPNAGNPSLQIENVTSALNLGSATSGTYSPSISLNGNIQFPNAGWVTNNTYTVVDSSVAIGKIKQSTLQNGTTAISSGDTILPLTTAQTVNISEGYNTDRTLIIGAASSGAPGAYNASVNAHSITTAPVVTGSLSGTISNIGTTTKPSGTDGTDYWTITPTGTSVAGVSTASGKATISSAGYLSTGSTVSTNHTVSITPTVTAGSNKYIVKGTITNNTSGGTSTATINRGKQIKISAGYHTADLYYTAQDNSGTLSLSPTATTTVSCDGKKNVSITLDNGFFTNTSVTGHTYADISNDSASPILTTGGGLFINKGYIDDTYISLAKLVPDSLNQATFASAGYILQGYGAWDADGQQITGNIATYNGDYVVS